jgi:cytochrome b subunit of formate dehydrogenase
MLPTLEDFDHAVATVQHWVRGTPKPKIGKFDFAQKFEYGGMLMGTVVMVGTGLVLIYPDTVSFVIPGEWVAAMRAMHGYEATFATLVVLLWHSWGVILRPEVFPLDTSIFTGKITKHRLKNEHWLEYERMFPEEAAEEAARTPGLEPPPPEPAEEGPDLRDDREGSDR